MKKENVEQKESGYVYKTEKDTSNAFVKELRLNDVFGWHEVAHDKSLRIRTFKRKEEEHNSELLRLEKKVNNLVEKVEKSEHKMKKRAFTNSLIIGVIATLIMGAGMSFVMAFEGKLFLIAGIVLGVVGMIGCVLNYPLFKKMAIKNISKLQPQVVDSKEKIVNILEQVKLLQK